MYINKLFLKYFGQFHNAEIELKPGMNLVYGESESGKTTVKESITAMLYGMDLARGLGDDLAKAESLRPWSERGYSGKAYIEYKGKSYLIERSFLRHNRKTSALDIQAGRELKLAHKDSLYENICPMDKKTFETACVIDAPQEEDNLELASNLNKFVSRYVENGSPLIDKKVAVADLMALCEQSDTGIVDNKRDAIEKELFDFHTVDQDLEKIRKDIHKVEEELAIETERRKREARTLIEKTKEEEPEEEIEEIKEVEEVKETKEEIKARKRQEKLDKKLEKQQAKEDKKKNKGLEYAMDKSEDEAVDSKTDTNADASRDDSSKQTENTDESSSKDSVADNTKNTESTVEKKQKTKEEKEQEDEERKSNIAMFLNSDLGEEEEVVKPLSEQLWFIFVVGIFVVAVIYCLVHMLPFTDGVRQIFVVCTALFVVVTIAEGLYENGAFQDDENYTPTDEEYQDVLHRVERKAEAFQDVEIDMAFAEEYNAKIEKLRDIERKYLNKKARRDELKEELESLAVQKTESNKMLHAMRLAINTINELAAEQSSIWREECLGHTKEFIPMLTDNKYVDVILDKNNRLHVIDNTGKETNIALLDLSQIKDIYYAIRFSLAKSKCQNEMPVILDDTITSLSSDRYERFIKALNAIGASQIVLTTSNENAINDVKRCTEAVNKECNIITLIAG